jgi:glucokinase
MVETAKNRVLTFDVGGSHVSAAVCFPGDYHLGPVASALHQSISTSAGFVDLLSNLGSQAAGGPDGDPNGDFAGGIAATLAVPGPFDLEAGVSLMRHKLPYLYGVDLRHALAARFGCGFDQVRFLNDANAYLLGEVGAGAGRGYNRVIGLTLGTGIGSAFTIGGRLVIEGPGVPKDGEIWNLPYESGIVEDYVSGRAITAAYARRSGKRFSAAEVAAAAPADPAARDAFTELGDHLGGVIDTLLAGFGADAVVVGGGISRASDLFLPAVRSRLQHTAPELCVSQLQERAALVGCGVAWFHGVNGDSPVDAAVPAPSSSSSA